MEEITPQEDILRDEQLPWEQQDASTGQRFANYIIDIICFYAVLFVGAMFAAAIIPGAAEFFAGMEDTNSIVDRIVSLILYGIFMALTEAIFKGRTLGKLITRTKAIRINGEPISFYDAFMRGLSRMVPFEALSGFSGHPWHDKWTDTRVVKIKQNLF